MGNDFTIFYNGELLGFSLMWKGVFIEILRDDASEIMDNERSLIVHTVETVWIKSIRISVSEYNPQCRMETIPSFFHDSFFLKESGVLGSTL